MGRIENLEQDTAAADALVAPIEPQQSPAQDETSDYAIPGVSLLNQAISEQNADRIRHGDGEALADLSTDRTDWRSDSEPLSQEEAQRLAQSVAKPGESFRREGEQRTQEQQLQQGQQRTPKEIEEGIQALDATVKEYELNDPASAKEFAAGFCEALGSDIYAGGVNVEALGNVMAKTALSAMSVCDAIQGDVSRLPAVAPESARAFTYDFLRSFGVDPRAMRVNEQLLAETVCRGAVNFIATYQALGGKVTNLDQLNDPVMAEAFLGQFLKAFGIEGQIDRGVALKLADAGGKYLLGFMNKVGQIQPRQQTGRRSNSQKRSRGSSRFQTNGDIFDEPTMSLYQREHGRM